MVSLKNNKPIGLTRGQIGAHGIKNSSIIAHAGQLDSIQRAAIQRECPLRTGQLLQPVCPAGKWFGGALVVAGHLATRLFPSVYRGPSPV